MLLKNIRHALDRVTESLRNRYFATPVIFDGDMGGDDLWAITALLAHKDKFRVLGISTVFGNVSADRATSNVLGWLHALGESKIDVAKGLSESCDGVPTADDSAYGESGAGDVMFDPSPQKAYEGDIAEWYKKRLEKQRKLVTIFVTGPATNIAYTLEKYPHLAGKIGEIIFMGGAHNPPGKNGEPVYFESGKRRVGNITPYAEFNAYKDPAALNKVIQADVPITFMSADATQYMVLNPARQDEIKAMHEAYGPALHSMLMVVEDLDKTKFGVDGPFIHDPNVITYALRPDLYKSDSFCTPHFDESKPDLDPVDTWVDYSFRGWANLTKDFNGSKIKWLNGIKDEQAAYDLMISSIRTTIEKAPEIPRLRLK